MATNSTKYMLFGLGFNGFGQLEISPDDANGTTKTAGDVMVTSPKELMVSSQSSFHVSIAWDSTHICAGEEDSKSITRGRWTETIESTRKKLGQRVIKVEADCVEGMVLRTETHVYVVKLCEGGELKLSEIPDDKNCSSFGVLSDGKLYTLTGNGTLHPVTITTAESANTDEVPTLQFGPAFSIPNKVPIVQMACGVDHVMLVTKSGDLFSFGHNGRGQLGQGDIVKQTQPTLVEALAGIKTTSIACGHWHSMMLSEFGDVYSCGWNEHKQLGHSQDTPVVAVPTLIKLPPEDEDDTNFLSISCGERHSVAVSEAGAVYTWGWNRYGQLGRSTDGDVDGKPEVIDAKIQAVKAHCGYWNTLLVGELIMHKT